MTEKAPVYCRKVERRRRRKSLARDRGDRIAAAPILKPANTTPLLAEYKRAKERDPGGGARRRCMLLAGNSQRQLGHAKEAEEIYRPDHREISQP